MAAKKGTRKSKPYRGSKALPGPTPPPGVEVIVARGQTIVVPMHAVPKAKSSPSNAGKRQRER